MDQRKRRLQSSPADFYLGVKFHIFHSGTFLRRLITVGSQYHTRSTLWLPNGSDGTTIS